MRPLKNKNDTNGPYPCVICVHLAKTPLSNPRTVLKRI